MFAQGGSELFAHVRCNRGVGEQAAKIGVCA